MKQAMKVPLERSIQMSKVRAKDTRPELVVRKLVYSLGYRYRLYDRNLPGAPDLVLRRRRAIVFVHGCFWHQHFCPAGSRQPKTRQDFWLPKLAANVARDTRNLETLRRDGWSVLVVWECETRDLNRMGPRLRNFIEGGADEVN